MTQGPRAIAPHRVVVVGGGISGLSTTHFLLRGGGKPFAVTLIESSNRLGGNILTERKDDFLLDSGPDSWIASKPHAASLAKALGLSDALIPTQAASRRVYAAFERGLHPYPEGLILGIPTGFSSILESPLLSWKGKARVCVEPLVPRHFGKCADDESLEAFFERRMGHEMTRRLVAPLLGGIFAGDAKRISLRATFPQLIEAEARFGSLVRAMRVLRSSDNGALGSPFLSLRGGLGTLIEALVADVQKGATLRRQSTARSLGFTPKGDGRYCVDLDNGERFHAETLVIAVPAPQASKILRSLDGTIADELEQLTHVSTATVFLAYRREDIHHPLNGSGFIVPSFLGRHALAGTWISSKWAERAPNGSVLMRVFFGGSGRDEVLERDDDSLVALARSEVRDLMNIAAAPVFDRVFRFIRSSPQPEIGHTERLSRLRQKLSSYPGLHIVGAGYDGVGIPDCIRQAESVAGEIARSS